MISFHPFGVVQEVGASCGMLNLGMRQILVDASHATRSQPPLPIPDTFRHEG